MTVRQLFEGLDEPDLDKELIAYVPLSNKTLKAYTPLSIVDFRNKATGEYVILNTDTPSQVIWSELEMYKQMLKEKKKLEFEAEQDAYAEIMGGE